MEKEKFYVHNKLLTYRDLASDNYLELSIDANSETSNGWTTLNPSTICFSIYDPKVNKNVSSICICVRYDNVVKLIDSINSLFNGNSDVFLTGAVIQIPQYTLKNRKELILNFTNDQNNQHIVQLTIIDTTSQRGRSSINLDKNTFMSMGKILKEFVEYPIAINIGIKQLLSYDRLLEKLGSMKDELCNKLEDIKLSIDHSKHDIVDINEYNEEPSQMSDYQKDFQKEFESTKGFSNIDLGLKKIIEAPQEDKNITKIDQPFISTCLNHDLRRLEEWVTSFVCTTEKSSGELFVPFDVIFNNSNIIIDDRKPYMNEYGYYSVQYLLMSLLKRNIKEAINTGRYPTTIPAIRFANKFRKETSVYKLSKDIITIFLLYSIVMNHFNNNDDMKRTYFVIKLLFSPFMFSIDITEDLVKELCIEYEKCNMCGMLDTIKEQYTSDSYGGKLNLDREIFETCCKSFVNTLKTKETFSLTDKSNIDKLFKDFKVDFPTDFLKSGLDIRNNIFKVIKPEETKVTIKEEPPIKDFVIKEDKRLKLFIDSSKGLVNDELINEMKNLCKEYNDLVSFFKIKDIPPELFKIKRILDINPTLETPNQVLKQSKILKEDIDVTTTRVIQEESVEDYNENFNVQDILSMDGI